MGTVSVLLEGRGRKKTKKSTEKEKHLDDQGSCTTLSEDIIATDILPRLPATSLLKFKHVSSSWRSLISDPSFARLHLDRSRTGSSQLMIAFIDRVNKKQIKFYACDVSTKNNSNNAARFLFRKKFREVQYGLSFVQHCNGLLLLSTFQKEKDLHVCNPSTREFITLPRNMEQKWNMYSHNCKAGLVFVPDINAYKVARYFLRRSHLEGRTCLVGFEILTLGKDSSWRVLAQDPPYPNIAAYSPPAYTGEGIYFEIANDCNSSPLTQFLCFNLSDEKFYVVDPPSLDITDHSYPKIFDLEGNPCIFYRLACKTRYELWTLEDCRNHNWIHRFSISLEQPSHYIWPVAVHHGKLLLSIPRICRREEASCLDHRYFEPRLEYYDPCSKSFERLRDIECYQKRPRQELRTKYGDAKVTWYVESLVSLRGLEEQ